MATARRPLRGHLLVTEGLVTKAPLRDALRVQAAPPHPRFEQVLADRGVLSQARLDAPLATYERKLSLGPLLLGDADATPAHALAAQRAGAELEAARNALALEREAGAWAREELGALRRRHEALGRGLDAALRALHDIRRRGGVGQSPDR
jgi:hypothetical protein